MFRRSCAICLGAETADAELNCCWRRADTSAVVELVQVFDTYRPKSSGSPAPAALSATCGSATTSLFGALVTGCRLVSA